MPHHFNFSYCTLYNNVRRSLPVCLEKNYFTWYFRGQGVPWVQIMEDEFECLVVGRGHGGHFAEKFVNKSCS